MKLAIIIACLLGSPVVRAHGTIPTDNTISFGPGAGGVLLGTNFGGILRNPDGTLSFICESAVTGVQQTVDIWLWRSTGRIIATQTGAGFVRGVFESDPTACGYTTVIGTEDYLVADLVVDPIDDTGFYAVGANDTVDMFMRGSGGAATILYIAEQRAVARGVRAAGGHAYATFTLTGSVTLVHHQSSGLTTVVHPLAEGESLRPLGVSPTNPTTLWLVRTGATGDTLLRSEDAGLTLTPVLTVDARIGGFAIAGDNVWVQSARWGVERSTDGGRTFTRLGGSPLGNCLALDPDGLLHACAVPWVDGYVLGVSDDGMTFRSLIPAYDDTRAIQCASMPGTTATCTDELEFLRGFYGFTAPDTVEVGEAGPEGDTSEPTSAETAEPEPGATGRSSDGCMGGSASGSCVGLMLFFSIATLWMAAFADVGASLIVANGLRLLRFGASPVPRPQHEHAQGIDHAH